MALTIQYLMVLGKSAQVISIKCLSSLLSNNAVVQVQYLVWFLMALMNVLLTKQVLGTCKEM